LSRSDNQRLPRVAMSDNHELTRPPLLILIDAPFSSRLSGHTHFAEGSFGVMKR
jgi:hypothetical protein